MNKMNKNTEWINGLGYGLWFGIGVRRRVNGLWFELGFGVGFGIG
jgi:hypothetical protein